MKYGYRTRTITTLTIAYSDLQIRITSKYGNCRCRNSIKCLN